MIAIDNLYKSYDNGLVKAVNGISLFVAKGETVSLMGPSGCGKSTLLNLIGALDFADKGDILVNGIPIQNHKPLHNFRSRMVGFVFQFHHLIPSLTILENVELPLYANKISSQDRKEKAVKCLSAVGLEKRLNFYPNRVSGGERQRTAIARSLINDPQIILADEPTGSVDTVTGEKVISLLIDYCKKNTVTMILATHNPMIDRMTERTVHMQDGVIV